MRISDWSSDLGSSDLKVMPTLAAVLSRGLGVTVAQLGFDYRYSVHGEQAILWHRPIPPQGEITGEGRVVAVYDTGDKGAVSSDERSVGKGCVSRRRSRWST